MNTVVFSDFSLNFSDNFSVITPDKNYEEHLFYTNTLYIVTEKNPSLFSQIKKYSRNSILVYLYDKEPINNNLLDYCLPLKHFNPDDLNLDKIKVRHRPEYDHLLKKYFSLKDEFIINEELNMDEIEYLQSLNVFYHYYNFLYLNINSLSRKLIMHTNDIISKSIAVENELAFIKNDNIIFPEHLIMKDLSLLDETYIRFYNIPYEVFCKLMCKISYLIDDEFYGNFFSVKDKFSVYHEDDTLYIIHSKIKRLGFLICYIKSCINKFIHFNKINFDICEEKIYTKETIQDFSYKFGKTFDALKNLFEYKFENLVKNFQKKFGKNIWLVAKVNDQFYVKMYLNQKEDLFKGKLSLRLILDSVQEINNAQYKENFPELYSNICESYPEFKIPVLTKINEKLINQFEWISYENSSSVDSNFSSYLDINNELKYLYNGTELKTELVDFEYIKNLCKQLSYEEKIHKNLLKVNVFGMAESGKTTLIHKVKTGFFRERQYAMTDGMDNELWQKDNNNVYFSDMGGQIIYISTNHLFFNDGDFFVLLFYAKDDINNWSNQLIFLENYCELIKRKCPNSKILLMFSKYDENDNIDKDFLQNIKKWSDFENYIETDSKTSFGIEEFKNILLDEAKKNSYHIPKSYEIILEKMKLLKNFIIEKDEFYEMIEGVDDKEYFFNFLKKIGFIKTEDNYFILGDISLSREVKKIITLKPDSKYYDKSIFTKEELRQVWSGYDEEFFSFMKNFLIKKDLLFEKDDIYYFPEKFDGITPYSKDYINKNYEKLIFCINLSFSIGSYYFFPKLVCRFKNYINMEKTSRGLMEININNCKFHIFSYNGVVVIVPFVNKWNETSIVLQIILYLIKDYYPDYLRTNCFNQIMHIPSERTIGKKEIFYYIDNQSSFNEYVGSLFEIDLNIFIPFYEYENTQEGKIIKYSDNKTIPYNFLMDYINLESIFPEEHALNLIYENNGKYYKAPISKNYDIFKCWVLGTETEIDEYSENIMILDEVTKTILKTFLEQDITKFEFYEITNKIEKDVFIPNVNIFGRLNYIFPNIKNKLSIEEKIELETLEKRKQEEKKRLENIEKELAEQRKIYSLDFSMLSETGKELYMLRNILTEDNFSEIEDEHLQGDYISTKEYLNSYFKEVENNYINDDITLAISYLIDRLKNTNDQSIIKKVTRSFATEMEFSMYYINILENIDSSNFKKEFLDLLETVLSKGKDKMRFNLEHDIDNVYIVFFYDNDLKLVKKRRVIIEDIEIERFMMLSDICFDKEYFDLIDENRLQVEYHLLQHTFDV